MADTLVTAAPTAPPEPVAPAPSGAPAPPSAAPPPPAGDWSSAIPPEYKDGKYWEALKGKPLDAVLRSYAESQKFLGASLRIPGPDAKPEERAAFEAKIGAYRGVPESAEDYTLDAPGGQQFDEGLAKDFKGVAKTLKLSQEQVSGLVSWFAGGPVGNPQVFAEQLQTQTSAQLKREWGGAFDYNLRVAQEAVRLTDRQSGAGLLDLLNQTGLGNHPAVIKHFHWLGKQFAEDGEILRDGQSGDVLGPAEAKAKIAAIRADRTHPFHRGEKAAVEEMGQLYQVATATQ